MSSDDENFMRFDFLSLWIYHALLNNVSDTDIISIYGNFLIIILVKFQNIVHFYRCVEMKKQMV